MAAASSLRDLDPECPASESLSTIRGFPSSLRVPPVLTGCFVRDYIKQSFRAPRNTDKNYVEGFSAGGKTWYLQSSLNCGLCVDARVDCTGGGDHDCFLGVALWNAEQEVVNWHPVVGYGMPTGKAAGGNLLTQLINTVASAVVAPAETADCGRVTWEAENSRDVWVETDVQGGAEVLEERWVRQRGSDQPSPRNFLRERQCKIRTHHISPGSEELLLVEFGYFAHVAVVPEAKTEFCMGKAATKAPWHVELATGEKTGGVFCQEGW